MYIYIYIFIYLFIYLFIYFPWWHPQWLYGKESACNAGATGDTGSIPGSGRYPGGGRGNPLQHSCLENPHGQKSLMDYSP